MWDNIRTFFDIFIVSLILYRVLVLMVGTRAIQLLKGILMLLLFSLLASMLQPSIDDYNLDNFKLKNYDPWPTIKAPISV